ncbi:MAG: hypothetical protein KA204_02850 [Chromatiaceae bacterium]|nr:hypothetical protein [Chromatiaceae bacterium]MBP6806847.1 hypothetical protein [Chromatiaceae bacterium]MBP8282403.1 hypothetical protein [Chromatiaceae bacterium]MBP8288511.1 hypothetical protein [Chromatiaceae bacterium]MBP9602932.1 hypothetical protein [Chromatiaceae bacterium]
MRTPVSRQQLSAEGLLHTVRQVFGKIPDAPGHAIALVDHLMSGLALFGLKYPSLLQFEHGRREETTRANLKALYGIERAPSDPRFRERLDALDPSHLRPLYTTLFGQLQRGKGLEGFADHDDHYRLSLDGTGYFSSPTIHCAQCAEKHHRNCTTTYYHQMLGAVLVPPDYKEVFPLAPEPILKPDGATKNDRERNAAKRLLTALRREHPHLKLIVVEDALAANGPHLRHLQALDLYFILAPSRAIIRSCSAGWWPASRPPRRASATRRNSATASATSTACRGTTPTSIWRSTSLSTGKKTRTGACSTSPG